MPETVKKKRIFQIAKELNISHADIISYLSKQGVEVSGLNSPVDSEVYEKILGEFSKDKEALDRFRKDQARRNIKNTIRTKDILEKNITVESDHSAARGKPVAKSETAGLLNLKDKLAKEKQRITTEKHQIEEKKKSLEKTVEKPVVPVVIEEIPDEKVISTKIKKTKKPIVGLKIISRPVIKESPPDSKKTIAAKKEAAKAKDVPPRTKPKSVTKPAAASKKPTDKISSLKKFDVKDIANKLNQSKKSAPKSKSKSISLAGLKTKTTTQIGGRSTRRKKKKSAKAVDSPEQLLTDLKKSIRVPEFTTVDELARSMNVNVNEVIKKCMDMGMMASINFRLDMESIEFLADEFGFEVETVTDVGQEILDKIESVIEDDGDLEPRPPVVTIMGHVDHGKTSLLDHIRKENVVAGESGGITQHIGAYEVILPSKAQITFIDTPGHAAFTSMRSRGAKVTDIVIIIIAADDGVMPQTIEAIDHAKAADVPIIIAINKIDRPSADPEKIKRELSERNILVEDWGGKYQCSEISAKSGLGIDDLLDKIIMESELLELKASKNTNAQGVVIESRLDKGYGAVATILINKGTLKMGDVFVCGSQYSKVRAILDERHNRKSEGYPSDPVQILGFTEVPSAGDKFIVLKDEREARKIALQRSQLEREAEHRRFRHLTLEQIGQRISKGEMKNLEIIIKGDVDGSIEAISDSLMGLSTEEVGVDILHRSVGMITENDVTLANASSAIIIAFNVIATNEARTLAKSYNIDIRHYSVIYDAINEIKLALEGLLTPERIETITGEAEVRTLFKVGRRNLIAGSYLRSGIAKKNSLLRVLRNGELIFAGRLSTLKRFKENVNEVKEGFECGISIDGFTEFNEGDNIEFYEHKDIKRKLA